jgi:drug/metabolite transporter (DMT)-like permease
VTPRTAFLAALALVAFAANSLLTRAAIGGALLDAAPFALLRIVTGAMALQALAAVWPPGGERRRPSWAAAWSLAAYLLAFTAAYILIGAAVGALLLFGSVQITMAAIGIAQGEHPGVRGWLGGALATAGLLALTLPGATAPAPVGAALMVAAGVSWGAYSLIGRGSVTPLSDTAVNFVRTAGLVAAPLAWWSWPPGGTLAGATLAAASGVLASGAGYAIWYAVLPGLTAWRAAVLQLSVPLLTAVGARVILEEPITWRLVLAGALIAIGVWLTLERD